MSVHDFVLKILRWHGPVTLCLTDSNGAELLVESTNRFDFLDMLDDNGYSNAKLLTVDVDVDSRNTTIWISANIL